MTRMRKVLALFFAIAAVGAVSASAAQATGWYHAETLNGETPPKLFVHGEQVIENVFHTTAGTVKCKTATFQSEVTELTVRTLTVKPTYGTCTAFGQTAQVTFTGANPATEFCHYDFTTPTEGTEGKLHAEVHIQCNGGWTIKVDVPTANCSLTIGAQTPTKPTVDLTNNTATGSTRDVLVTSTVEGISYTVDGPGTACGTAGAHNDGTYTGTVTVKGWENAAHTVQAGVWATKE
jgi:hypothetical protein